MAEGSMGCYFVQPNEGTCSENSQLTFKVAEEKMLEPKWINEKDCFDFKTKLKNTFFVIDPFGGEAYEHLKNLGCRILGPHVVLWALNSLQSVPKSSHPLYCLSMKGMQVSVTNVSKKQRGELLDLVSMMGGTPCKDLTSEVTHLVAGEPGSKKYIAAGSWGKKIMSPEWVTEVWKQCQSEPVGADNVAFEKFRCPIFKDFVVTASGISAQERNEVKRIVEVEGGRYTGEMKINECSHLIINHPKGQKYEFARKWKIHIVTFQWLLDSYDKGYCQDVALYGVKDDPNSHPPPQVTSTPAHTQPRRPSAINDMSTIGNMSTTSHINETNMTYMSRVSEEQDPYDAIDLTQDKPDMFLDGCKIFLSGFTSQKLEILRKIVNIGGGTRLNKITANISHVVMGEKIASHVEQIEKENIRPHIVHGHWLLQCFKQGKHVPEADFECLQLAPQDPLSPSIKRQSLNISTARNKSANESLRAPTEDDDVTMMENPPEVDDVMSQYLPQNNIPDLTDDSALLRAVEGVENDMAPKGDSKEPISNAPEETTRPDDSGDETPDEIEGMPAEVPTQQSILGGKTFVILGFETEMESQLVELVNENGGKVFGPTKKGVPDYGVVPILGCEVTRTVGEVVTNAWLQICIEDEMVHEANSNPAFVPVELQLDVQPLDDCVVSISGYKGTERDCLMHLAELLGAKSQEYFVRRASKGYLATTHLLINEPGGSKYEAAKKWGIPIVTNKWIFVAGKTGKKPPEEKYHIDAETADQNTSVIANNVANTSTAQAPETHVQQNKQTVVSHTERTSITTTPKPSTPKPDTHKAATPLVTPKPAMPKEATPVWVSNAEASDNHLKDALKNSIKRQMVKEINFRTPKLVNSRVKALMNTEGSGKPSSLLTPNHLAGVESPSAFLDPNKSWYPDFDFSGIIDQIESPEVNRRKSSLSDDELKTLLKEAMVIALKNSELSDESSADDESAEQSAKQAKVQSPVAPLHGVVIGVSKKLTARQADFNSIANALGADYRWTYDTSCTHFIYQSNRSNDMTKEFRLAKEQAKHIVSPHWLTVCQEQNARVDESLFPHNYNPNMTLSISKKTPARTRLSRRSMRQPIKEKLTIENSTKQNDLRLTEDNTMKNTKLNELTLVTKSTDVDVKCDEKTNSITDKDTTKSEKVNNDVEMSTKESNVSNQETKKSDRDLCGAVPHDESANDGFDMDTTQSDDEALAQAAAEVTNQGPETQEMKTNSASLEMRDEITKQLEHVMASVANKPARKRNSRINSANLNSSGENPADRSRPSSRTRGIVTYSLERKDSDGTGRRSTRSAANARAIETDTEASQRVQFTWDDPRARMEKERLAEQLNGSLSPEPLSDIPDNEADESIITFKNPMSLTSPKERNEDSNSNSKDRITTPEPPPLAFPLPKNSHQETAQPIELIEEESRDLPQENIKPKEPPFFLLSGLTPEERDDYGALVEQIGGTVSDSLCYDPRCTHLVIGQPTRNEKFLSCVAAGKWVLHKSYLEECREAGHFVEEAEHEWGSDNTLALLANNPKGEQAKKLARAAKRWRNRLQDENQKGAFSGWRSIVYTDTTKASGFSRLLQAGGAEVTATRPPFTQLNNVSHAFMELHKVNEKIDLALFLSAEVKCLKPDYIAAFLTDDPPPDTGAHCIPEVSKLKAQMNNETEELSLPKTRKRKPSTVTTPSGKRTRKR
ncbi:unnamed protein product [Owenia fusiformis]|uniref:Uncharacterized protein n=1 Tax=Owenia fusiformis TaxID=6347 RepID=A0A8J1UBV2_OWEFU|nr:unnamed protein product [Owenia fusiformis]